MRTEIEVREQILNLSTELENIISTGESEKRELADNETNRMAEIRSEIDSLENELKDIEEENRKIAEQANNNKEKSQKKMVRLFDLVKEVVNGNVSDEHRAYVNGNSINYRSAIQATATGMGEENVPEDKAPLELAIRNASVLDKLGVTWFGNAVGNISIPKYHGSNVYWADSENADAQDGASGFTEVTLSPKRLTAYITISRQFLAQSPPERALLKFSVESPDMLNTHSDVPPPQPTRRSWHTFNVPPERLYVPIPSRPMLKPSPFDTSVQ